jgi:hypothetical protein
LPNREPGKEKEKLGKTSNHENCILETEEVQRDQIKIRTNKPIG